MKIQDPLKLDTYMGKCPAWAEGDSLISTVCLLSIILYPMCRFQRLYGTVFSIGVYLYICKKVSVALYCHDHFTIRILDDRSIVIKSLPNCKQPSPRPPDKYRKDQEKKKAKSAQDSLSLWKQRFTDFTCSTFQKGTKILPWRRHERLYMFLMLLFVLVRPRQTLDSIQRRLKQGGESVVETGHTQTPPRQLAWLHKKWGIARTQALRFDLATLNDVTCSHGLGHVG